MTEQVNTYKPDFLSHEPDAFCLEIPAHTDLWYKYRATGIPGWEGGLGASEVATVLGLNDYKPTKTELFRLKVGLQSVYIDESEPMFHGTELEDYIRNIWRFHDGKQYIQNFREKRPMREVHKPVGYVLNKKYPHLFVSPDGIAPAGTIMLYDGEKSKKPFNVEVKKINSMEAKKWEGGIPVKYVIQAQVQMLVMNMDYTEIILFIDGQRIDIVSVHASSVVQKKILEETDLFWETILNGRSLLAQRDKARSISRIGEAIRLEGELQKLEPLPDSNENYTEHYSERFTKIKDEMKGTADMYSQALDYLVWSEMAKAASDRAQGIKNAFAKHFVDNSVEIIDFATRGKVKYTKKEGGANYIPYFYLKCKANADAVSDFMDGVDVNLFL